MNNTIERLTLRVITEELENILVIHPEHLYQTASSIPDLRSKLITYVLNQISKDCAVNEEGEPLITPKFVRCCLQQRLKISSLIDQGIQHILYQDSNLESHPIPEKVNQDYAPSHWFG